MAGNGRGLPTTAPSRAAAVLRIAGIQNSVAMRSLWVNSARWQATLSLSGCFQTHRNAPPAKATLEPTEAACDGGAAMRTSTARVELATQHLVPVTLDQRCVAARAEGRAAVDIVHVARVDVMQPLPSAIARARISVAGGVGGRSSIL